MRAHIEFIQVEHVPRQPLLLGSAGGDVRILSHDPESGALTALVNLPAAWTLPAGRFTASVEFYLLTGTLMTEGYAASHHTYAFIPAGVSIGPMQTRSPVTLLWFTHGEAIFEPINEDAPGSQRRLQINALDASALPWVNPITPGFPPGAMRKQLRIDPDTGASTWLLGVLPQWREPRIEIHPVAEEAFILQGEMATNRGVMSAGSYFWRPPHVPHGPFHTDIGALILFRTNGHLQTFYRWPEGFSE